MSARQTNWALVWSGPVATAQVNAVFPNMGERYPIASAILDAEAGGSMVRVDPATRLADIPSGVLERVHDADYIEQVDENYLCDAVWPGENPALATMAGISFDSTILAAHLVATGEHQFAYALASGQHHAKRNLGGGFCVYNDVVGAALVFADAGLRPLVLDIDVHAGDGTQSILWNSEIPTISIHAGSIFPHDPMLRDSAQEGKSHTFHWPDNHAYNVVVNDAADDETLRWAFDEVDPIVRRYAPDVIIFVVGADGHVGTSLTGVGTANVSYTYAGFDAAADRVRAWANEFCHGRVLMTSAGGYQPLDHTPRIWANVAMRLAGFR